MIKKYTIGREVKSLFEDKSDKYICEFLSYYQTRFVSYNFTWEIYNPPETAKFNNNENILFIAEPGQKLVVFGEDVLHISMRLTEKITLKQVVNYIHNFLNKIITPEYDSVALAEINRFDESYQIRFKQELQNRTLKFIDILGDHTGLNGTFYLYNNTWKACLDS